MRGVTAVERPTSRRGTGVLTALVFALLLPGYSPSSCNRPQQWAAMTGDGSVVGALTSYEFSTSAGIFGA